MADAVITNGVLPVAHGEADGNAEERPIVLKFGGTSVGKFAPEIAQICL